MENEVKNKEVEKNINVPYIVYEGALARMERTVKRLFILVIVTTLIAFVSNVVWLYWWNQYDYVTEDGSYSYEQDGSGINLIGDRNNIGYGTEIDYPPLSVLNPRLYNSVLNKIREI